jgi:hypothetical protein
MEEVCLYLLPKKQFDFNERCRGNSFLVFSVRDKRVPPYAFNSLLTRTLF